ncbi:PREDICTED: uncharacterized protein LOC105462871 isoform X2 [Wasmannia auropunctata]|uniref:uncharacterized protein LOC105462871 isoform X2 n=1 Tax=Wasmannia auropunctata TaxID=64793 RepID=UPI0005F08483|nr:PREDICTED: uncharacterized protein LOC105462871 isoform X2 [Wasmannia auropunctata]
MAVLRTDLNARDEISTRSNDRTNGNRFARRRMDSRIFLPRTSRCAHSVYCPYSEPQRRRPLTSYVRRLSLQYEHNWQAFADSNKIHNSPIQPEYKSCVSFRRESSEYKSCISFPRERSFEEPSKRSFSAGARKSCWSSQIKRARKRLSYLLPVSSLAKL